MKYFYVICPVGADPEFAEKRAILESIGRAHGVEPFFPLKRNPVFSIEGAKHDIEKAEFVFADLSLQRPSCYFELGLAESVNSKVSLLAIAGTPIHQIGTSEKVRFYSDLQQYRFEASQILAHYCGSHPNIEQ